MPQQAWTDLPLSLREALAAEHGPILSADSTTEGVTSAVTARVRFPDRTLFCKATPTHAATAWMHRTEAAVNSHTTHLGPRLHTTLETDGWLLLAFDLVDGRYADLSPTSPDLELLTDTLTHLAAANPTPWTDAVPITTRWAHRPGWQALATNPSTLDPWSRDHLDLFTAAEREATHLLHGDALLHTDLHPYNLLVTHRIHVIDWALACRGAAWIDTAHLVIRLIAAGHTPTQAEHWATTTPTWHTATPDALTTFAITITGLWQRRAQLRPTPATTPLLSAARSWTRHRLTH